MTITKDQAKKLLNQPDALSRDNENYILARRITDLNDR